jgi:hypothetical protein
MMSKIEEATMFKNNLGFAFLAAALLSTAPVYSQSANLTEAAKRRKAVVYGSLESDWRNCFNVQEKNRH